MKKVLIVGLTCLDILNLCDHFPKEDEDVRVLSQLWLKGGNAANTACVLAQYQNIEVHLLSCLSGRNEHKFIMQEIEDAGVNIKFCPVHKEHMLPTSSCIINKETGSRTILHSPNEFPSLVREDFFKVDVKSYDWVHFEGRDLEEYSAMIDHVVSTRGSIKPVVSGEMEKVKKLPDLEIHLMPKVDVLFVSKDIALHKSLSTPEIAVRSFSLNHDINAKYVICPWGNVGAAAAEKKCQAWNYHTCDAVKLDHVVDTLGAGDTFIAGVIFGILENKTIHDVIKYGCELAGRKCAQYGFKNLLTGMNT